MILHFLYSNAFVAREVLLTLDRYLKTNFALSKKLLPRKEKIHGWFEVAIMLKRVGVLLLVCWHWRSMVVYVLSKSNIFSWFYMLKLLVWLTFDDVSICLPAYCHYGPSISHLCTFFFWCIGSFVWLLMDKVLFIALFVRVYIFSLIGLKYIWKNGSIELNPRTLGVWLKLTKNNKL